MSTYLANAMIIALGMVLMGVVIGVTAVLVVIAVAFVIVIAVTS